MAKDDVLFGYALLDDTQSTVSIDDIDRPFSRQHKFFCPHCHNEMYATFGEIQSPHFRHNGDKCQHSKYLHDLAEHVFYEEYSKCLDNGWPFFLELRIPTPCNKACVLKKHLDCREHYIQKTVDLTKDFTQVSLEPRVDLDDHYRRPDVLLESSGGKQLWIEIWVSHETEEAKRKDGRIIEIKIDTEKDLEKIRQHKIIQSEGEDLAVRIFGIETDGLDVLFEDEESVSCIKYPCEKYLYFDIDSYGCHVEVFDDIRTTVSSNLSYRVILRLNWKGRHDSLEGPVAKQTTEENLRDAFLQKYHSFETHSPFFRDITYDSLIEFEWKAKSFRPAPNQKYVSYHRPNYKQHFKPQPLQALASTPVDTSNVEWVDLGLPSGILWAKEDVEGKTPFLGAKRSFGLHVPSRTNACELIEYCTKKWDDSVHALVFTGPNGNSISFPCKGGRKSYWLDAYEQGDPEFGQCYHIDPEGHFWINDKSVYSSLYVRLIKR